MAAPRSASDYWTDWSELSPIFWTAVRTTATIGCVMLMGVCLAVFPRRTQGTVQRPLMKSLSGLCFRFFLPCMLITKIGRSFTPAAMRDAWIVAAVAPLGLGLSCACGFVLRRLCDPPRYFQREFIVGLTFQNAVGLPLIFMETLCEQPLLAAEAQCMERAVTFIFLNNLSWQLCLWTAGLQYMMAPTPPGKTAPADGALDAPSGAPSAGAPETLPIAAADVALTLAVRRPAAATAAVVDGGGDGGGGSKTADAAQQPTLPLPAPTSTCAGIRKAVCQPPIAAMFVGICVGMITPLQDAMFTSTSSPLRPATNALQTMANPYIGVVNLIAGCSLGKALQKQWAWLQWGGDGRGAGAGGGAVATATGGGAWRWVFVLGRVLLIPAALVGMLLAVLDMLPADRVLRLVMLVVCVMPSANNNIILCQLSGRVDGAEALAKMMVLQYAVGLVTMTAFTVLILTTVLV